jgi:hypothetical protein
MQPDDTSLAPYDVPFDFDLSAFVNANYAEPKEGSDNLLTNRRI